MSLGWYKFPWWRNRLTKPGLKWMMEKCAHILRISFPDDSLFVFFSCWRRRGEKGWVEGVREKICFLSLLLFHSRESTYKLKWEFYYMLGLMLKASTEADKKFITELFFRKRKHFCVVFCDDAWNCVTFRKVLGICFKRRPAPHSDHQFFICPRPPSIAKLFLFIYLFHQSNVLHKLKAATLPHLVSCVCAPVWDDRRKVDSAH